MNEKELTKAYFEAVARKDWTTAKEINKQLVEIQNKKNYEMYWRNK